MEDVNIIALWKEQSEKIDQSLSINRKLLFDSLSQKANNSLRSLIRSKAIGIVIAVLYLVLLGVPLFFALLHYNPEANYFIVSFGAIFLINIKALYDYIKHLVLANYIKYDSNIMDTQQQLTRLQLSIAQHVRTMFLQLPFWTTFFLSSRWFPSEVSTGMRLFQIVLTSSFVALAIFLYIKLTLENIDKKWVKSILSGAGGRKVADALTFYKELEAFKLN